MKAKALTLFVCVSCLTRMRPSLVLYLNVSSDIVDDRTHIQKLSVQYFVDLNSGIESSKY